MRYSIPLRLTAPPDAVPDLRNRLDCLMPGLAARLSDNPPLPRHISVVATIGDAGYTTGGSREGAAVGGDIVRLTLAGPDGGPTLTHIIAHELGHVVESRLVPGRVVSLRTLSGGMVRREYLAERVAWDLIAEAFPVDVEVYAGHIYRRQVRSLGLYSRDLLASIGSVPQEDVARLRSDLYRKVAHAAGAHDARSMNRTVLDDAEMDDQLRSVLVDLFAPLVEAGPLLPAGFGRADLGVIMAAEDAMHERFLGASHSIWALWEPDGRAMPIRR